MTDTQKKRRWIVPALVVSLAINLLVAGIVIGALVSGGGKHRGGHDGGPARGFIGEPFLRALPQEDRRALAQALRENPGALQETREALRERVQGLLMVLRSDPSTPPPPPIFFRSNAHWWWIDKSMGSAFVEAACCYVA